MNTSPNIIPITKARGKLGELADLVSGENYILLTKGGSPKAALVDISYLSRLQSEVRKIFRKTFIDPKLLPFTRKFSDKEIREWEEKDTL
jgi:prevent-host-death family protein